MDEEIDIYIRNKCRSIIDENLKIMVCSHDWFKEGFGYKCSSCDYYTGLNDVLNREIEKLNETN